jgi:hypothetical protein
MCDVPHAVAVDAVERTGDPGLLEDLTLHRRDRVLVCLDSPFGQGPKPTAFLEYCACCHQAGTALQPFR